MSGDHFNVLKPGRLGFGRACVGCRQRKHRCDGFKPVCGSCRSRGSSCHYSVNEQRALSRRDNQHDSIRVNVRSLSSAESASSTSAPQITSRSLDQQGLEYTSPEWPVEHRSFDPPTHNGTSPTTSEATLINPNGPAGYFGDSSAVKFVVGMQDELQQQTASSLELEPVPPALQAGVNSTVGLTPEQHRAFHALPERGVADVLLDAYFERVHLIYPFLHEPTVRDQYECLWDEGPNCSLGWLAVANMLFAYGCEFCPSTDPACYSDRATPYVDRAKSIILSQVFLHVNMDLIQALLLLCHYLQGALELNECWNLFGLTIRSAMSIGLHIDPTNDDSLFPVIREVRKRVWWGCFALDRTLSMKFGRPPSISTTDALDVELPLDVDDQYIANTTRTPRQPSSRPSRVSLFIQTIQLSLVIDNILATLYQRYGKKARKLETATPTGAKHEYIILGNIILLDGQLQAWWNNVPSHLKIAPDVSDGIDAERQRNVMHLRYLQLRLLLLRPSLIFLTKHKTEDDILKCVATASAKQCISLAQQTIQQIHLQYHQGLLNSVWYLLHYMFSSLGILQAAQALGIRTDDEMWTSCGVDMLQCGMDFLRSLSQGNALARRYVTLLERHRNSSSAVTTLNLGRDEPSNNAPTALSTQNQLSKDPGAQFDNFRASENTSSIHVPDPYDFLFGMGLSNEFLIQDIL